MPRGEREKAAHLHPIHQRQLHIRIVGCEPSERARSVHKAFQHLRNRAREQYARGGNLPNRGDRKAERSTPHRAPTRQPACSSERKYPTSAYGVQRGTTTYAIPLWICTRWRWIKRPPTISNSLRICYFVSETSSLLPYFCAYNRVLPTLSLNDNLLFLNIFASMIPLISCLL